MNKVKFILLVANFIFAMALTVSCSDDNDSSGKEKAFGCRPGAKDLCFEVPISFFTGEGLSFNQAKAGMSESCRDMNEDDDGNGIGIFYENGCSSENVLLECDCSNVNYGECQPPLIFYFYEEQMKNMTCNEAFGL